MARVNSKSVTARLGAILRPSPLEFAPAIARPEGKLIWIHLPENAPLGPVRELCISLKKRIKDAHCLVTLPDCDGPDCEERVCEAAIIQPLPPEQNNSINAFLDHWKPDILLWSDGMFRTRIIQRGKVRKLPMYLVNLPTLDLSRRLLRRSISITLSHFRHALVASATSSERLQELGFPADDITVTAPLSEVATPLEGNDLRRKSIVGALNPRAVWFAAHLQPDELAPIITAHRQAQNSVPGLILIIYNPDKSTLEVFENQLLDQGLKPQIMQDGQPVEPQTEVVLSSDSDDLGIWYRMATVSFIGGSISGKNAADPFDAVALGSAVICGSITGPHQEKFRKLFMGEAVVSPDSPDKLGDLLIQTLAPDRAAELAIAAWKVGSEGVDAVQSIVDLTASALGSEAPDATT